MPYLYDLGMAKLLACLRGIVSALPIVHLLPLLLKVVHRFLLLLTSGSGMETHKMPRRIQFEALRAMLRVNANQNYS